MTYSYMLFSMISAALSCNTTHTEVWTTDGGEPSPLFLFLNDPFQGEKNSEAAIFLFSLSTKDTFPTCF